MVSASTYGGWAGIFAIAGGYWYLSNRRNTNRSQRSATQKQAVKSGETRKDAKSKKQRSEGAQSAGEQVSSSPEKKQKKKKQSVTNPTGDESKLASTAPLSDNNDKEDEVDNQEFARQFQNAKAGTIGTAQPQAGSKQKSVKQSQAKDVSTSHGTTGVAATSSEAPSTAGDDGDDDLSAANSPPLSAVKMDSIRSGDVSDMLEKPSAGPSVLKINAPEPSFQTKKERKPAQSSEPTETKKQRQNRKKAEARKEARAEDEKERRVLLEKQRRTAREAQGRAAKDGSSFMAAKAPVSSVWTAPPTSTNTQPGTAAKGVELLDTYEPNNNGTPKSSMPMTSTSAEKKTGGNWDKTLPSEEEQMRLLEEETAWNTVTSKKSKKKVDSEQVPAQKPTGNEVAKPKENIKHAKRDSESLNVPVTIVGDPSLDLASYTYNGAPANAILENGDGKPYGYTLADDEWEVA
jgi:hypothetical protein